jgi:hypothetical protein
MKPAAAFAASETTFATPEEGRKGEVKEGRQGKKRGKKEGRKGRERADANEPALMTLQPLSWNEARFVKTAACSPLGDLSRENISAAQAPSHLFAFPFSEVGLPC